MRRGPAGSRLRRARKVFQGQLGSIPGGRCSSGRRPCRFPRSFEDDADDNLTKDQFIALRAQAHQFLSHLIRPEQPAQSVSCPLEQTLSTHHLSHAHNAAAVSAADATSVRPKITKLTSPHHPNPLQIVPTFPPPMPSLLSWTKTKHTASRRVAQTYQLSAQQ